MKNSTAAKQVRFIISSATGGDYDQWSRLIARYLGKYIPGNPAIVPQNMPGGGQIIATNHLFNAAAQDGTVIGMIGRNLPNDALVKKEGVRFDPLKFNWLGSPELTNRVCVAIEGAPVQEGAGSVSARIAGGRRWRRHRGQQHAYAAITPAWNEVQVG